MPSSARGLIRMTGKVFQLILMSFDTHPSTRCAVVSTTTCPTAARVAIDIFDVSGRRVRRGEEQIPAGSLVLQFQLTNPNQWDVAVSRVLVEVIHAEQRAPDSQFSLMAAVDRNHTCEVSPMPEMYEAKRTSEEYDYIKLRQGESERFNVLLSGSQPSLRPGRRWFYTLRVLIEYTAGDRIERIQVGEDTMVVFVLTLLLRQAARPTTLRR